MIDITKHLQRKAAYNNTHRNGHPPPYMIFFQTESQVDIVRADLYVLSSNSTLLFPLLAMARAQLKSPLINTSG